MLCIIPHKGNAKANANPSETHYTLFRVAEARQGWGTGTLTRSCWEREMAQPLWKIVEQFLTKKLSYLLCDPAVPLP